jgi:hypothetical protein
MKALCRVMANICVAIMAISIVAAIVIMNLLIWGVMDEESGIWVVRCAFTSILVSIIFAYCREES